MLESLLQNPHPAISSAPLVLLGLLVLSETLKLFGRPHFDKSAARLVLFCLLVVSVSVYFSGILSAGPNASQSFQVSPDQLGKHQESGVLYLLSLAPMLVFFFLRESLSMKSRAVQSLYSFFLLLSFLVCIYTSHLGGELVFGAGAGVRATHSETESVRAP